MVQFGLSYLIRTAEGSVIKIMKDLITQRALTYVQQSKEGRGEDLSLPDLIDLVNEDIDPVTDNERDEVVVICDRVLNEEW